MDNKDQNGNEELIIENCKRCNPYCKVAKKNNTELCFYLVFGER